MFKRASLLCVIFLTLSLFVSAAELKQTWSDGDSAYSNGAALIGLDISPDRSKIYTLDESHLREWEAATGRCTRSLKIEHALIGPRLSTDGSRILIGTVPKLYVLETKTFRQEYAHEFPQDIPGAFVCDGNKIVVGTKGGKLWKGIVNNLGSWEMAEPDREWEQPITWIARSNDGKLAVSCADAIRIYDSSLALKWEKLAPTTGIFASHFLQGKNKQWLAVTSVKQTFFFDPDTGESRSEITNEAQIMSSAAFNSKLALGGRGQKMVIYDVSEPILDSTEFSTESIIYAVCWLGASELAGFSLTGDWYKWESRGRKIGGPTDNGGAVSCVSFGSLTGASGWVAISRERGIKVFSWPSGDALKSPEGYKRCALRLRDGGSGKMIALYADRSLAIFDVERGVELGLYKLASIPIDAYLDSDGKPVYLSRKGELIKVTSGENKDEVVEEIIKMPSYRYWAIARADRLLLASKPSHDIVLVNMDDASTILLGAHFSLEGAPFALSAIDAKGDTVASVARNSLMFWSKKSRSAISSMITFEKDLRDVQVLDEKRAAVGFNDGGIAVVNRSGAVEAEYTGSSPIMSLACTGNGVLAGLRDGAALFFEIK